MEHPNTNPGQPESGGNGHSTPEEVEGIRAQLATEQDARLAAETVRDEAAASIAERDARIAELEGQLTNSRDTLDAATADIEVRNDAYQDAVSRLAEALRKANPNIPSELIRGETPGELEASVESASALVKKVREQMDAERAAVRVPAGAPPADTPSLDGLSARDKIAAGIKHPTE